MKNYSDHSLKAINIWLFISTLEGLLAVLYYFHQPSSMERNAFFWGLSPSRLAIGVLFSILFIFLGILSFFLHQHDKKIEKFILKTIDRLRSEYTLLTVSIILILIVLSLCQLLFIFPALQQYFSSFLSPAFDHFVSTLLSLVTICQPLISWTILFLLQLLALLIYLFHERYKRISFYQASIIWKILLIYLAFVISLIHWAILYFRLYIFIAIPNWFWKFYDKPLTHSYFFPLLFLLIISLSVFILSHPARPKLNVFLAFTGGVFLMVGFGYIEGNGFETLRQLFIQKGHWGYARYACTQPGLLETLRNYENVALLDPFFKTKPPGVFAFYISIQQFVNMLSPADTLEARYTLLTRFMSYTFPLLAFCVLFILYQFVKQITGEKNDILACLLYIFFPNVILTPLFLDQEFYPLLFMLGLLLSLQIILKQSNIWAFITGVYLYISIYFSFSLLPLIALVFLWIGIDYLINRNSREFKRIIVIFASILLGIAVSYTLFRLFLNYDIFIRYSNAMASHRTHKEFLVNIQSLLNAVHVNNAEFFSWIGFPIVLLLFSRAARVLGNFLDRTSTKTDSLFISLAFVYFMLNLSGQTHGEVARLWIFLVPMASFFSSLEIRSIFKTRSIWPIYFIVLQLITMFLLFRYQDLD